MNQDQQGFRTWLSCLSQLLAHCETILQKLEHDTDIGVVYRLRESLRQGGTRHLVTQSQTHGHCRKRQDVAALLPHWQGKVCSG